MDTIDLAEKKAEGRDKLVITRDQWERAKQYNVYWHDNFSNPPAPAPAPAPARAKRSGEHEIMNAACQLAFLGMYEPLPDETPDKSLLIESMAEEVPYESKLMDVLEEEVDRARSLANALEDLMAEEQSRTSGRMFSHRAHDIEGMQDTSKKLEAFLVPLVKEARCSDKRNDV